MIIFYDGWRMERGEYSFGWKGGRVRRDTEREQDRDGCVYMGYGRVFLIIIPISFAYLSITTELTLSAKRCTSTFQPPLPFINFPQRIITMLETKPNQNYQSQTANVPKPSSPSGTSPSQTISSPPIPISQRKTFLSRLNESNRILGIFFGCIFGMILGIVLVRTHQVSIVILGVPSSPLLEVITVLLAMGTGGNLCGHVGIFIDVITGERTVFDGVRAGCEWWRHRGKKEGKGEVQGRK